MTAEIRELLELAAQAAGIEHSIQRRRRDKTLLDATGSQAMSSDPCGVSHDFENVTCPSRAVFICPRCKQDISLEYLFWAKAAHPEWFEDKSHE